MNAEQIVIRLIELFTQNLVELSQLKKQSDFVVGESTAYVDCLENIQLWDKANNYGLTYNIAKKFLHEN